MRLEVADGADASHAAGARSYRGLTIHVRDELGRPAPGAEVTFRLPETGPTGLFPGGSRAETVHADGDGVASVWGIEWGPETGAAKVIVTARKGVATGGVMTFLQIVPGQAQPAPTPPLEQPALPAPARTAAPPPVSPVEPAPPPVSKPAVVLAPISGAGYPSSEAKLRAKWIVISLAVAGALGGAYAWNQQRRAGTAPPPAGIRIEPALAIGAPSVTVGSP